MRFLAVQTFRKIDLDLKIKTVAFSRRDVCIRICPGSSLNNVFFFLWNDSHEKTHLPCNGLFTYPR